ncbi:hypothetical protein J6590_085200 [Homalodisca vitripennis]|nr:hypothetical protein J6590_085200 [Homalodisca vitripennis]
MNPRISTFAVSDVLLLDIHKVAQIQVAHRFLLCPVVGSTDRYKPARSDPCWVVACGVNYRISVMPGHQCGMNHGTPVMPGRRCGESRHSCDARASVWRITALL